MDNPHARALQLVSVGPNNSLILNENTLNILRAFPSPIYAMSCVGVARTGKSCLLNLALVAQGQQPNFSIGDTTSTCTEGIDCFPSSSFFLSCILSFSSIRLSFVHLSRNLDLGSTVATKGQTREYCSDRFRRHRKRTQDDKRKDHSNHKSHIHIDGL